MQISKEDNRKNRVVAVVVTLMAFSFLLLTLFLKKIIPASPKESDNPVLFSFAGGEYSGTSDQNAAAAASGKTENKSESKAEVKSALTEQESVISAYKNFPGNNSEQQSVVAVGDGTLNSGTIEDGPKGDEPSGITYSLGDRQIESFPKIPTDAKEQGTIVVNITVNQDGLVVDADPNGRGTTSNSVELKNLAKKIALQAKFSNGQREMQKGTISIIFAFE